MNYLDTVTGIQPGPKTPEGVYARVVDGRTFYVNTTEQEKSIPITGSRKGIIGNRVFKDSIVLGPLETDLFQ